MSHIYLTWYFIKAASDLNRSEFVNTFNRNLASTVCPGEENKAAPVFTDFKEVTFV